MIKMTDSQITMANIQINMFLLPLISRWVRVIRAKKCLKKYLKLRLYRRRVRESYICRVFNEHYIEHPLHTLIPYEEKDNYLSEELREKYRRSKEV